MGGEALQNELSSVHNGEVRNPFEKPISQLIQEKFSKKPEFWRKLFEIHLPHPLDSHPKLLARIEALGLSKNEIDFPSGFGAVKSGATLPTFGAAATGTGLAILSNFV